MVAHLFPQVRFLFPLSPLIKRATIATDPLVSITHPPWPPLDPPMFPQQRPLCVSLHLFTIHLLTFLQHFPPSPTEDLPNSLSTLSCVVLWIRCTPTLLNSNFIL